MTTARERAHAFCRRYGLSAPVMLAPMAGVPSPALSVAVGNAGGMASLGALLMSPADIAGWVASVRAATAAPIAINLWIPDPPPLRDARREAAVRTFLGQVGPAVAPDAANSTPPDFAAQCDAILSARPAVVSSIMGLFSANFVERAKAAGVAWFA